LCRLRYRARSDEGEQSGGHHHQPQAHAAQDDDVAVPLREASFSRMRRRSRMTAIVVDRHKQLLDRHVRHSVRAVTARAGRPFLGLSVAPTEMGRPRGLMVSITLDAGKTSVKITGSGSERHSLAKIARLMARSGNSSNPHRGRCRSRGRQTQGHGATDELGIGGDA